MTWKEYLSASVKSLFEYLKEDIQYARLFDNKIRQIAWREIELFIEGLYGWTPEQLILRENTEIYKPQQLKINKFIKKRKEGIPLGYILKKQTFYGLEFKINKNTLIPRPETEELVELVINNIKTNNDVNLVDIGTGSGCIITAILKNSEKEKFQNVYVVEKSRTALKIAKENIQKHLGNRFSINYSSRSLLENITPNPPYKWVIVANLPYLSKAEYEKLSPEVRKYEPKSALVGGKEGHELICRLVEQTLAKLPNFEMYLEISPIIYPKIKKHLAKLDVRLKSIRDLNGKVRFLYLTPSLRSQKY